MAQIQLAVQLRTLRLPLRNALKKASELGAAGIEIDLRNEIRPAELSQTGVRQFRKMLTDLNLKICSASFPTRRGYQVLEDLDQRIAATKKAMDAAYQLGAPILVNQIGKIPDDPESESWNLLTQAMIDLGTYGHKHGVVMTAKTGSEDAETLAGFIKSLPDGHLAVDFDPGALVINGVSTEDSFRCLAPMIRHVRAKDGVQDLARGRGIEVPLGRGSVDFPLLMAMLDDIRYQGYLTIERENPENPVLEVEQALQYCRSLLPE